MTELLTIRSPHCRWCDCIILRSKHEHLTEYLQRRACSIKCAAKLSKSLIKKVSRYCKQCNTLIEQTNDSNYIHSKRLYCSRNCAIKTNAKYFIQRYCLFCNNNIEKSSHDSNSRYRKRKFCNIWCQRKYIVLGVEVVSGKL